MISANAADLEYTECLTAASIFITQVICAFQEVNSELSAKERTEEEVRELQNIPRIMHGLRHILVRLSAIQNVLPRL
ncbi:hypothetical protein ANAPH2_00763 [Anaplasma phagocytophilum]|nr:hypothetical protein ANAPH2_00763 [Anaplasma phagocytophilum]